MCRSKKRRMWILPIWKYVDSSTTKHILCTYQQKCYHPTPTTSNCAIQPQWNGHQNALISIQWQKDKELWDRVVNTNTNNNCKEHTGRGRKKCTYRLICWYNRSKLQPVLQQNLQQEGKAHPQYTSRRRTKRCTPPGIQPSMTSTPFSINYARHTYSLPSLTQLLVYTRWACNQCWNGLMGFVLE